MSALVEIVGKLRVIGEAMLERGVESRNCRCHRRQNKLCLVPGLFIQSWPASLLPFRRSPLCASSPAPTNVAAGGRITLLLADAEAERDRYQLLLDINNAVVTQPGSGERSARDLPIRSAKSFRTTPLRSPFTIRRPDNCDCTASICNTRATLKKAHYFRWKGVPRGWPSLLADRF